MGLNLDVNSMLEGFIVIANLNAISLKSHYGSSFTQRGQLYIVTYCSITEMGIDVLCNYNVKLFCMISLTVFSPFLNSDFQVNNLGGALQRYKNNPIIKTIMMETSQQHPNKISYSQYIHIISI